MPKTVAFDPNEAEQLKETSGTTRNTQNAKRRAEKHFKDFLVSKNEQFTEVFHAVDILQPLLIEYFSTYRLDNNELPKKATLMVTRSHIKMMIKKASQGRVDINDSAVFSDFDLFWKGLIKKLKREGKADKNHHDCISQSELKQIYHLLGILTDIIELDENDPGYEEALNEIPEDWREKYNHLVLFGAIFVFIMQVRNLFTYFYRQKL